MVHCSEWRLVMFEFEVECTICGCCHTFTVLANTQDEANEIAESMMAQYHGVSVIIAEEDMIFAT